MLNNSQRVFCQHLADGLSHTKAYQLAYPNCKNRNSAGAAACRLLRNVNVQVEMRRLRLDLERQNGLSRQRKRELLFNIGEDPNASGMVRIGAIKEDNKMMGHDRPPKVEYGDNPLRNILAGLKDSTGLPYETGSI